MRFYELLKQVTFEEISAYFMKDENEKKYIEKYRKLFNELLNMKVTEEDKLEVFLVYQKDYFEGIEEIEVLGFDREESQRYGLDFMERDRWLGSKIVEKSLKTFGAVAFVCECMKEMSFISFDEEDVEKEREILNERIAKIEDGTEEFVSAEEVFSNIREKYDLEEYKEPSPEEKEKRHLKTLETMKYNYEKLKEMLDVDKIKDFEVLD